MQAPGSSTLTLLTLSPLIVWRIYARLRKMFGRQRLSRYRAPITLAVYSLLSLWVAHAALANPGRVGWLIGSLLAGAALSLLGIRHTQFEARRGEGLFYTPNAHLGFALSALFLARIAWRVAEVYWLTPAVPRGTAEFMGSATRCVRLVCWRATPLATRWRSPVGALQCCGPSASVIERMGPMEPMGQGETACRRVGCSDSEACCRGGLELSI